MKRDIKITTERRHCGDGDEALWFRVYRLNGIVIGDIILPQRDGHEPDFSRLMQNGKP